MAIATGRYMSGDNRTALNDVALRGIQNRQGRGRYLLKIR